LEAPSACACGRPRDRQLDRRGGHARSRPVHHGLTAAAR
jgi:hypothetical protein